MATREAVIAALFARLTGAYAFAATTRRIASPNTMAAPGAPALGIVTAYETYHSPSPNAPPRRTMTVLALVYINTGLDPNGIPDAVLNDIQDAIDAALKADDATTGRCTLGGLVYSAAI